MKSRFLVAGQTDYSFAVNALNRVVFVFVYLFSGVEYSDPSMPDLVTWRRGGRGLQLPKGQQG